MASSNDGDASNSKSDEKKRRRKNSKPRHLSSYGKAKTPVQPSETETKSQGKRVCLNTDSDVRQMKKNTSSSEPQLVLKEPVLENNPIVTPQLKKNTSSSEPQLVLKEPFLENVPIVTPQLRPDQISDPQHRPEKVKNPESNGFEYEHCVKIVRQLERSGHVERSFRESFLTWFSFRATTREIRVVKTFMHSFKDDSVALAEQLVDTFSDFFSRKGSKIGVSDGGGSSGSLFKKPRH